MEFTRVGYTKQYILKNIKYNILINNSGGPKGGRIIDASIMQFNETFNIIASRE